MLSLTVCCLYFAEFQCCGGSLVCIGTSVFWAVVVAQSSHPVSCLLYLIGVLRVFDGHGLGCFQKKLKQLLRIREENAF